MIELGKGRDNFITSMTGFLVQVHLTADNDPASFRRAMRALQVQAFIVMELPWQILAAYRPDFGWYDMSAPITTNQARLLAETNGCSLEIVDADAGADPEVILVIEAFKNTHLIN
jgi:hypothetical protein